MDLHEPSRGRRGLADVARLPPACRLHARLPRRHARDLPLRAHPAPRRAGVTPGARRVATPGRGSMIAKEPAVRRDNARDLLSRGQRRTVVAALLAAVLVAIAAGRSPGRLGLAAESLVGAIMVVYVVVITFKSVLVTVALREHRRYRAPVRPAHRRIPEDELPRYTVLAPVHRESAVLAQLLGNLDRLNYPRDRLEILILVEGDDEETNAALDAIALPVSFRRVVVPVSYPRTKPKACNVGLAAATGTYCVIYD